VTKLTETMIWRLYLSVPGAPPSVNHYVKHTRHGGHYKTGAAESFKQEIALAVKRQFVIAKKFRVDMEIVLAKGDKGDIDNFPKLVLDGLADAGVFRTPKGKIVSDAHVCQMGVTVDREWRPECGYTCIKVTAVK